jgi:hypothetical protein
MTHIEQLHLDAINNAEFLAAYSPIPLIEKSIASKESAEITENIACEFAIFFSGVMPMNCKEIMRRLDLPNEEKVKLVFKEYLKTKENDKSK